VLVSMSGGATGLEVDMPSLSVCEREMRRINETYHVRFLRQVRRSRAGTARPLTMAHKVAQGRGRPRVTQAVSVRLPPLQLKYIDEWRLGQLDQPSRWKRSGGCCLSFTLRARAGRKHFVRPEAGP
jgi:hypothetical protein